MQAQALNISIHALLAESDAGWMQHKQCWYIFLSTLSLRRATYWATRARAAQLFLSTLSLRRATMMQSMVAIPILFLSTLSLRRATNNGAMMVSDVIFLSTLSLRRATYDAELYTPYALISIHALLAESDNGPYHRPHLQKDFYPRSPCGERRLLPAW